MKAEIITINNNNNNNKYNDNNNNNNNKYNDSNNNNNNNNCEPSNIWAGFVLCIQLTEYRPQQLKHAYSNQ